MLHPKQRSESDRLTSIPDVKLNGTSSTEKRDSFSDEANKPPLTLFQEFRYLAIHDRKWWIIPLLLSLVCVAVAVALTQSALLPFVYTLF